MIEPVSDTWKAVKQHAEKRISELREVIENPSTPDAYRRDCVMRLAEVRDILGLEHPAKPMPKTTPVQY